MKKICCLTLGATSLVAIAISVFHSETNTVRAEEKKNEQPPKVAVERARKTINMLDNIYKQTVVLITDKYVHDEEDFAAGSAAVLLFKRISESGSHQVRLIDATGEPYEPENVAKDEFEKQAIKKLKAGANQHEQITTKKGKPYLRVVTPVPVVMKKCVMCHDHYADVKKGEPIGAISYTIAID